MKSRKKAIVILSIKQNKINLTKVSKQTQNLRESTNKKIKVLGNRYYEIKNIFNRLNLKRDDIFNFGKQLEYEYKYTKTGIHLQNQSQRMKDALFCWYAQYFYQELTEPNSVILEKLKKISQYQMIIKKQINKNIRTIPEVKENKASEDHIIKNIQQVKFNLEVDSNEIEKLSIPENTNFDYDKLLDF